MLAGLVLVLILLGIASTPQPDTRTALAGSTTAADALAPDDLAALHISGASALGLSTSSVPGTQVSPETAIAVAANRVGRSDPPSGLLLAQAPRYVDEPSRQVYIVLYPGGQVPGGGPSPGIGTVTARITGVIVDAQTGEVLRWFMIS
jgi:hypothetical protein